MSYDHRRLMVEQVTTATPAERLLMVYDRLVLDIAGAREAKVAESHETANTCLLSAQAILVMLATTMDHSWDGAERLDALYRYCWEGLVKANVENDLERLDEVAGIVGKLHEAWQVAAMDGAPTPVG